MATDVAGVWSVSQPPLPAGAIAHDVRNPLQPLDFGAALDSVSCPSAGSCVAVGSYDTAAGRERLIETLSGGVWTATKAPLPGPEPAKPVAELLSVACPVAGRCEATGDYLDASSAQG